MDILDPQIAIESCLHVTTVKNMTYEEVSTYRICCLMNTVGINETNSGLTPLILNEDI